MLEITCDVCKKRLACNLKPSELNAALSTIHKLIIEANGIGFLNLNHCCESCYFSRVINGTIVQDAMERILDELKRSAYETAGRGEEEGWRMEPKEEGEK